MLNEHELRRTVVAEMHLRRWPQLVAPCTIMQVVSVVAPEDRAEEQDRLADLPAEAVLDPGNNPRHVSGRFASGVRFGWERHSEASTLTLILGAEAGGEPGASEWGGAQALEWALRLPGKVLRATRIAVVEDEAAAAALLPGMDFEPLDLITCYVGADNRARGARIWSDFRLRQDGFGRIVVAANGMAPGDLSRTVQRLQELGNYRNLALLGLPVAQAGWKVLDGIERQLGAITGKIARPDVTDDALLEDATRLSIELASEAATSDYRMSATEAYATLVAERLEDLSIRPCRGYQSLSDFTQRRLLPAVRTCAAHRRRSEQLAQRTAQFVSLFRTRIETRIENQNARLLASMERNGDRQLRLQQLVEGFSVVALTYYGVSLAGHLLEGLEGMGLHMNVIMVEAALVPVVAGGIWLTIHRMKARVLGKH